jgi:hypothetical protein
MLLAADSELREWGVDWVTLTAKDRESRELMLREGKRVLDEAAAQGDDVCAFRWKGYEGWTTGGCDVANREDTAMVRLHGATAREEWWDVGQFASNCSRIDFQLTFRSQLESPAKSLARCWRAVQRSKAFGKPIEWHYRRDSKKGNTLELGRRPSEKFGRIYDKGKESKLDHYEGCIRLEVEFKGDTAWSNFNLLSSKHSPAEVIPSEVRRFFSVRGVDWGQPPDLLFLVKTARSHRDVDRFLRYVHKCVRPGVERAVALRGIDAVCEALGLSRALLGQMGQQDNCGPLKEGS